MVSQKSNIGEPPKIKADTLLLSGDLVFYTLQGEGPSIGKPAVFIRLHMCNLACKFENGQICDAWYTWNKNSEEYWTEHANISFDDLFEKINKFNCDRLVFTGGEPLMQQDNIRKFLEKISNYRQWQIEIETNGTLLPLDYFKYNRSNVQINCSPKLLSSGNPRNRAINTSILTQLCYEYNTNFKFVATSLKDFDEIEHLCKIINAPKEKIYIMPEGTSPEILTKRMVEFVEEIKNRGWNLTPRLQCFIWGNKRRV
jgi:organic radical activating enzyme